MKKLSIIVSGLILLLSLNGCIDFGEDIETEKPNENQVNRCFAEMYLNPSMELKPLGFKLEGSGIDDAIWFKFKTNTTNLSQVFDTTVVDVTKFKENFTFLSQLTGLKWWDVKDKNLLGGQIALPNARYMNVGIEKINSGYIIYIMWHET